MAAPCFVESGSGDRCALFLHGIGGGAHAFDQNLSAMPEGWRSLAWWAPGYGASAPLDTMTFSTLADSAIWLLDDQNIDQAVIVGHSMGGMIAQEIVAKYPDRVSALVLFATSAAFGGRDDSFKNKFLADRLKPLDDGLAPADFADKLVGGMFGPQSTKQTRALAVNSMAAVPAATYRQALTCIVEFNRKADLGSIPCPTLVLAAEKDSLSPPPMMARMAEAIPDAEYHCLMSAGHLANMEDPGAFNDVISRFLNRLPT